MLAVFIMTVMYRDRAMMLTMITIYYNTNCRATKYSKAFSA